MPDDIKHQLQHTQHISTAQRGDEVHGPACNLRGGRVGCTARQTLDEGVNALLGLQAAHILTIVALKTSSHARRRIRQQSGRLSEAHDVADWRVTSSEGRSARRLMPAYAHLQRHALLCQLLVTAMLEEKMQLGATLRRWLGTQRAAFETTCFVT